MHKTGFNCEFSHRWLLDNVIGLKQQRLRKASDMWSKAPGGHPASRQLNLQLARSRASNSVLGHDSHARHLLCGNDLKAAGVGILSQAINVFSMDAPWAFNHSPMSLAASFPWIRCE